MVLNSFKNEDTVITTVRPPQSETSQLRGHYAPRSCLLLSFKASCNSATICADSSYPCFLYKLAMWDPYPRPCLTRAMPPIKGPLLATSQEIKTSGPLTLPPLPQVVDVCQASVASISLISSTEVSSRASRVPRCTSHNGVATSATAAGGTGLGRQDCPSDLKGPCLCLDCKVQVAAWAEHPDSTPKIVPGQEGADIVNFASALNGRAEPQGMVRQVIVMVRTGSVRTNYCLRVYPVDSSAGAQQHTSFASLGNTVVSLSRLGLQLSCGGRAVRAGPGAAGALVGHGLTDVRLACVPVLRGGMPSAADGGSRVKAVLARARDKMAACESILQTLMDGLERDALQAAGRGGGRLMLSESQAAASESAIGDRNTSSKDKDAPVVEPHLNKCGRLQKISADSDEREIVGALFKEIDGDHNGILSLEEMLTSAERYKVQNMPLQKALATALEKLIDTHSAGIDLEGFRKAVQDLPKVRGERVHFAQSLGLDEVLAGLLPKGTFFDGLEELKRLKAEEAAALARRAASQLSSEVEVLLLEGIRRLQAPGTDNVSALEQNNKFSMDGDMVMGTFEHLQDFYDGPEKLIGTPNPNATEGIRREHCKRKNKNTMYTTPNYKLTFSPKREYYFVVRPSKYKQSEYPHTPKERDQWTDAGKAVWLGEYGRNVIELKSFKSHPTAKDAKLGEAEIVSLRLYTGPLFMLYNAVLRGCTPDLAAKLEGNRYETTIFCIISGIIKLSQLTEVPEHRRLYRGLGGIVLPDTFWSKSKGFRGGVEKGLMSATADRAVAMKYSGTADKHRRCTIFEITVGRVDIGADLTWLSQYPNEKEVGLHLIISILCILYIYRTIHRSSSRR